MKQFLLVTIFALALFSCRKEAAPVAETKQPYFVRVQAAGTEIYYSNVAAYASVNGGQSNENELSKLTFVSYAGDRYMLDLTNKQGCGIDFGISWLHKDTTIYVPALETKTIMLPGAPIGGTKIKSKPLYTCGTSGGDLGWVEVETPVSLPIKFTRIYTETVPGDKNKLKIIFDVEECEGVNTFNVQLSRDGKNYKNVAVIFPDETQPNRTYSVIINI